MSDTGDTIAHRYHLPCMNDGGRAKPYGTSKVRIDNYGYYWLRLLPVMCKTRQSIYGRLCVSRRHTFSRTY